MLKDIIRFRLYVDQLKGLDGRLHSSSLIRYQTHNCQDSLFIIDEFTRHPL